MQLEICSVGIGVSLVLFLTLLCRHLKIAHLGPKPEINSVVNQKAFRGGMWLCNIFWKEQGFVLD